MQKGLTVLLSALTFFLFLIPKSSYAHPGRTASDGCHYCRTNCAKWGEVQGARHCHGGSYVPPSNTAPIIIKSTPTPTRKPTSTPTRRPTMKPTSIPQVLSLKSDTGSYETLLYVSLATLGGVAYLLFKSLKDKV